MLKVTSGAFEANGRIPEKYTGEGQDVSPPLKWELEAGGGVKSFALICDDPDAPRDKPWVHWVVYGLPGDCYELEEGSANGGREGMNDFGNQGYGGPMPPEGHGVHHYHFKVYALDQEPQVAEGATKDQLLEVMEGHIMDEGELIGTYER